MAALRIKTRGIMSLVLCCALLVTCWRTEELHWVLAVLVITAGPALGATAQSYRGRSEILGGVVGGAAYYFAFWLIYLWRSVHLPPGTGDGIGPVLFFFILPSLGASIGMVVGIIAWVLKLFKKSLANT